MENNITELVFILDKSGSMAGMESDTIGGFNAMIEKQKEVEGKAYVSTVLFSNFSEVIHDRVPIDEIEPMTDKDYRVGGCTALLDAIGGAVKHINNIHKYARPEDVPDHTIFVITTDGLENASRTFNSDSVKKLIKEQEEKGWEFVFVAANIDSVETAATIGIARDRAVSYYVADETVAMYESVGQAVYDMRRSKEKLRDVKAKVEDGIKTRKDKK